jgi:hypothetical protein
MLTLSCYCSAVVPAWQVAVDVLQLSALKTLAEAKSYNATSTHSSTQQVPAAPQYRAVLARLLSSSSSNSNSEPAQTARRAAVAEMRMQMGSGNYSPVCGTMLNAAAAAGRALIGLPSALPSPTATDKAAALVFSPAASTALVAPAAAAAAAHETLKLADASNTADQNKLPDRNSNSNSNGNAKPAVLAAAAAAAGQAGIASGIKTKLVADLKASDMLMAPTSDKPVAAGYLKMVSMSAQQPTGTKRATANSNLSTAGALALSVQQRTEAYKADVAQRNGGSHILSASTGTRLAAPAAANNDKPTRYLRTAGPFAVVEIYSGEVAWPGNRC